MLSIPNGQIIQARRVGNTTRLIDHIIQLLYTYPYEPILIVDHYNDGTDKNANDVLVEYVMNRIHSEHYENDFILNKLGSDAKEHYDKFTITYNPK